MEPPLEELSTEELLKKRSELKALAIRANLQQTTQKTVLNSVYGSYGSPYFRFFDLRQAEAVTMVGQTIIRFVANSINEYLNKQFGTSRDYVIASDTDSVYLKLSIAVANMTNTDAIIEYLDKYCETELQEVIDNAFKKIGYVFNTQENVLAMKREAIAEYGIWTAKKRYLLWLHDNEGVRYDPPKLKTVGVEVVRSSTPKIARDHLKKAIEYFILRDEDSFYKLIETVEHEFMTRPFTDIASPRTCSKMDKYPILPNGAFSLKTPIQVKGSLIYNKLINERNLEQKYPLIREGEKIRFCYLKERNPLGCNVIAAPHILPTELNLEKFIDRREQFEKTFVAPLEKIIAYGNWSVHPNVTLF